ncbi:FAD-dependent oxidoreductase [Flavobacterium selenitireducens]|uniref:FAD-dependent oxidoreductase n=1 Tax=Flavobacterium selenitireducens TaxID=2722704 RepID=UPI00168B0069|nr:FAD-dependent oxidoreductase [Flavobacterium selenitireducens]MBD3581285.1 FAD-dependent oxidoreductase [Flavobacterium selenitireducens]
MQTNPPFDSNKTAGLHQSYWTETAPSLAFGSISAHVVTEVLVVGAGISGLTTAYYLLKAGKRVVIVDDGNAGSGETGRTTAHITCALDDRYYDIERIFSKEDARLAAESHTEAIRQIEAIVSQEGIDCNFMHIDGFLFRHETDPAKNLDKEFEATQRAGIPTDWAVPPGIDEVPENRAIRFPSQAQFHAMHYLNGLARAVERLGGKIYTQSKATDITSKGAKVNGFDVAADQIVVATNSPSNDIFAMHTKQAPYRSYVIGARIKKGALPYALWWDTGDQESKWTSFPYHYVRLEPLDDAYDLLISGGEDHKTGQAASENLPEEDRYTKLEAWTRGYFPLIEDVRYRWSGQVMEPVDCLAFIGRNPGNDNVYIATGDSGNGITHGTIAGKLITDLIVGNPNPYEKLYDPSRISLSTAKDFISEQANVAKQYADWFSKEDLQDAEQIAPGQGAVIGGRLDKKAAYRNDDGTLEVFSAVCPHLGCIVRWNNDEKSFDCPCHGSRFDTKGCVLNGPATSDLEKRNMKPASDGQ